MDYIGNKCPVCDKYFHIGDDIVVCPECGTPAHRECYESLGKCVNHEKHTDDFVYTADNVTEDNDEYAVCHKCGAKNPKEAFFCNKCGSSLGVTNINEQNTAQSVNGVPFGGTSPYPNVIVIDPLAGVKPDSDIGDGVTAGEMAKLVRQNTPYFIKVFSDILNFSKSRFNFCAALFAGGYLLYRKMYKIGAFVTTIQAAIMILSMYIQVYLSNSSGFLALMSAYESRNYDSIMQAMSQMSTLELSFMYLLVGISFVMIALRIVCGVCFNRMYYNHCKKQVQKIKAESDKKDGIDNELKSKGGVNVAIALSLFISYMIIQYLPYLFM